MTQTTFTLLTNKGRSKEAAALANNSSIQVSHIAIGDGATVPSGGETQLYHELARKPIFANGLVSGATDTAYFEIYLNADEGPYTIREAGLFDAEGDLLAIAHYDPPIAKPTPESGQTVEGTIRLQVQFSNTDNIVVKVDSSIKIPLQRLTLCLWVPVNAIDKATPPNDPNLGDTYIIPENAEGIWKGQANKIAEYTAGGWAVTQSRDGHGIGLPDGSIYTKINGKYVPLTDSLDKRYSQLIAPPTDTFYVIGPNGNDNNTGFSTSPKEGFRTIQGAINKISSRYITTGTITINVSSGMYEGFFVSNSMVANWIIKSLDGDKKSVLINATEPNKPVKNACSTFFGTQVDLADMTLAGLYDTVATTQGTINIYNCDIMMGNASNSQAVACYGGAINLYGDMTISGSGSVIFHATTCGNLGLGYYDVNSKSPLTITYKDAKASWATFVCEKCSNVSVASAVVTFIGVPDSMSYTAIDNGIINTWGAGANIFPGTRGPWVGSGGIVS